MSAVCNDCCRACRRAHECCRRDVSSRVGDGACGEVPAGERWRAEVDAPYYFITPTFEVEMVHDCDYREDVQRYVLGNYFECRAQAERLAREFRCRLRQG